MTTIDPHTPKKVQVCSSCGHMGDASVCYSCTREAKMQKMENGLKAILKHCEIVLPHGYNLMTTYRIAEESLSDPSGEKE